MPAGGYGLFQRGERRGLRQRGDRTADRHGPSAASSAVGRALPSGTGSAAKSNAGRGDGASAEDAGRPGALRAAQADPGAGVRDHQIGAGIPSIFPARPQWRARRMEPRHHGLEHQADVRPHPRLTRLRCGSSADRPPRKRRYPAPSTAFCTQSNAQRRRNPPKSFAAIKRNTQSDRLLAIWDQAERSAVFASGMAAISTTLFAFLRAGDTIVHSRPLYGGTETLLQKQMGAFGVTAFGFADGINASDIRKTAEAARARGRVGLILVETPANPTNGLVDLTACASIAADLARLQGYRPPVVVDNTMLGPMFQTPL